MNKSITLHDFNIADYPGLTAQDVIPKLIQNLSSTFEALPKDSVQHQAIQTYIRLLKNYLDIYNSSKSSVQTIELFNELTSYLLEYAKNKYPNYVISIAPKGRIKSPLSANTKIKEKINDYMKKGKDLDSLDIKDFIAFRIVVDVRDSKGALVPQDISVAICYDIVNQAVEFMQSHENTEVLKITSKPQIPETVHPDIYIPSSRPESIEEKNEFIKDYIINPKPNSNYQSIHLQFKITDPTILENVFGEIQLRTFEMNEHAEHGAASHTTYKSREQITYLALPKILVPLSHDSCILSELSPDECFREFFGFSPSLIDPTITYDFLRMFLESTDYEIPIKPLYFRRNSNGKIIFNSPVSRLSNFLKLKVVGTDDTENLMVFVGDLFEKQISQDVEHEFY